MGEQPIVAARHALLRPACEVALAVAYAGERVDPPVPAPAPLKRFFGFAKLPARALDTVRRVVDEDESFRARVAEVATEELAGEAGLLWLRRPPGWEEDLATLAHAADAEQREAGDLREERRATKRLDAALAAQARLEERLAGGLAERDRALQELASERQTRRRLESEITDLTGRLERLEVERTEAVRRWKQLEVAESARVAELRAARAAALDAEHELSELRRGQATPVPPVPPVPIAPPRPIPAPPDGPTRATATEADLAAVAKAVTGAAEAAAALARSLSEAAEGLLPSVEESTAGVGPAVVVSDAVRRARERRPTRGRRAPVALPGGVFDDTVAAAEHVLRAPDVRLLVDGYNVTKSIWADLSLTEQRNRLVDLLDELGARTGAQPDVVFDGADDPTGPAQRGVPRAVRVRFSPAGVDADDVILDLLDELPAGLPVAVVSDDRRVRDGAVARGANVLSVAQLLGSARRGT